MNIASWVFGGLFALFLMAVVAYRLTIGGSQPIDPTVNHILGIICAVLAGLFAFFLSGTVAVQLGGEASSAGNIAVQATGGLALFVLVLWWWRSDLAPTKVQESSQPRHNAAPSPEESVVKTDPPIGSGIILDLSHGQENWNGLTAWAAKAENLSIRTSRNPFSENLGVLIFALPHKKVLADEETKMIKGWVERGGGLLILGYYAADSHHGSNVSRLTREWGVSFNEDLLMPTNAIEQDTREHVFRSDERYGVQAQIDSQFTHPVFRDVKALVVVSGASINTEYPTFPIDLVVKSTAETTIWRPEGPMGQDGMRPMITRWFKVRTGPAPVAVAFNAGRGKVAICATWKLATLSYADNFQFTSNLIEWLRPT